MFSWLVAWLVGWWLFVWWFLFLKDKITHTYSYRAQIFLRGLAEFCQLRFVGVFTFCSFFIERSGSTSPGG